MSSHPLRSPTEPGSPVAVAVSGGRLWLVELKSAGQARSVEEIWLKKASFVNDKETMVVGTAMSLLNGILTRKHGWSELLVYPHGRVWDPSSQEFVRRAEFVRLRFGPLIQAFGVTHGLPFDDIRSATSPASKFEVLATYGPARASWRGDLGGLNYDRPDPASTQAAIFSVQCKYPDAVIINNSDDWDAPAWAQPAMLARRFGAHPYGLWHQGASGLRCSGIILPSWEYAEFCDAYKLEFGFLLGEAPVSRGARPGRVGCGCWQGDACQVILPPRRAPTNQRASSRSELSTASLGSPRNARAS